MPYGLTDAEWINAKEEIRNVLVRVAGTKNTIFYSDLVDEILAVQLEPDSHALAHLLGEISTEESEAGRGMLSVIVVRKGEQMPGPGFFKLAQELGRKVADKEMCWVAELQRVYSAHAVVDGAAQP